MQFHKPLIIGLVGAALTVPALLAQTPEQRQTQERPAQPYPQNQQNQQNQNQNQRQDTRLHERQRAMSGSHMQASQFIGQKVRNAQGEELGEVKDLIFDLRSGAAPVVIVGYGGALGVGATRVAIPIQQFSSSTPGELRINTTRDQLEAASKTASGHWTNIAQEDWARQVNRFYGEPSWTTRNFEREGLDSPRTRQPVRDRINPNTEPHSDTSPFENEGKGAPRLKENQPGQPGQQVNPPR